MKKLYLFILLVTSYVSINAQEFGYPYISEVFYDTPMKSSDDNLSHNGEFIEIFNPSTLPCSLERWVLTGPKKKGRYAFGDITIPPKSSILVIFREQGNSYFTLRSFLSSIPYNQCLEGTNAFYQNIIQLEVDGDIIQLIDDRGEIIDWMAYGKYTKEYNPTPLPEGSQDLIAHNGKWGDGYYTTDQLYSLQRNKNKIEREASGFTTFNVTSWGCISLTPNKQPVEIISTWNYIREKKFTSKEKKDAMEEFHYFDGLGRLTEVVQKGITTNKEDIITLQEYDIHGRISKNWLPIVGGDKGAFIDKDYYKDIILEYSNIYNHDANPYSKSIYENSPSNRVIEKYGAGEKWHKEYGNDSRLTKTEYLTNSGTSGALSCRFFKVNKSGLNTTLTANKYYKNNQLFVVKKTDEDLNISYDFKNKSGQLILSRRINNKENYDTYYVYDDFGNLQYVLPPLATDNLSEGLINDDAIPMKQYAYLYKYDERNRCTRKRIAGTDWIYYGYDSRDRLLISQDGEQRNNEECSYYIYDDLNRVISIGECPNNDFSTQFLSNFEWHIQNDGSPDEMLGAEFQHTLNVYDKNQYSMRKGLEYDSTKEDEFGIRYGDNDKNSYKEKGLLVAKYTSALPNGVNKYGGSVDYTTTMYYDNRGRLIQSRSNNHLNGVDATYIAYNFVGQPIKKRIEHTAKINNIEQKIIEIYTYKYDHGGRLLTINHSLNNNRENLILQHTYDNLGRLQHKWLGYTGEPNLISSYNYNIRSWLTEINNADSDFNEKLDYTYGGNIKTMEWSSANYDPLTHVKSRGYSLTYDDLSQLKKADYMENGEECDAQYFNVDYDYDKHGNIKKLNRHSSARDGGMIDELIYIYTGNQLKKIEDVFSSHSSLSEEFKNWSNKEVEYTFNKNGAMTQDLNKGITNIKYNHINLPMQIDIKSPIAEARNEYLYSADGVKRQTIQRYNPNYSETPIIGTNVNVSNLTKSKTTDYIENKIYENGKLKRILVDNGYYDLEKNEYCFYLKDHLGNNRLVIDNDGGRLVQLTNYYPFGLAFNESEGQGTQPYKYNGKEFDKMHGLNLYDYSARFYDPAIGRFTSVDPHTENYYSWSPYVYTLNNPLRWIDKDGRDPGDYFPTKDLAAADFVLYYNGASIIRGREFGSTVYSTINDAGEVAFSYSVANIGGKNSVIPSLNPAGTTNEGILHTHGNYIINTYKLNTLMRGGMDKEVKDLREKAHRNNNDFSPADKATAKGNGTNSKDMYVGTPSGEVKRFDVKTGKTVVMEVDGVAHDPNDPNKKGSKEAKDDEDLRYNDPDKE